MDDVRVPVAEGVSLRVLTTRGDGRDRPQFVLVHGLASNAHLWGGVAAELGTAGFAVAAVDLRGHGRSDKPDVGYDVETVARDVRAVIRALELDRPVVAGQSWGGNIALELGFLFPELVRGIVCVDGGWIELTARFADWETCKALLTPPPLAGIALADLERGLRASHPSWPESGLAGTLASFEVRADGTVAPWFTLDRHLLALRGLWEHRPSTRYPDVRPSVVLVPADDGASWIETKQREVAAAGAALPRSRTQWMTGDHDLHAQHPAEVAGVLRAAVEDGFFA
jgi:pimeloyl-ACP methyl ester carboxylesterase